MHYKNNRKGGFNLEEAPIAASVVEVGEISRIALEQGRQGHDRQLLDVVVLSGLDLRVKVSGGDGAEAAIVGQLLNAGNQK